LKIAANGDLPRQNFSHSRLPNKSIFWTLTFFRSKQATGGTAFQFPAKLIQNIIVAVMPNQNCSSSTLRGGDREQRLANCMVGLAACRTSKTH
jgi:hypothetical protein